MTGRKRAEVMFCPRDEQFYPVLDSKQLGYITGQSIVIDGGRVPALM
ncbi:hypothetical protein ACFLR4_03135 [Bacteroidota bacterium]